MSRTKFIQFQISEDVIIYALDQRGQLWMNRHVFNQSDSWVKLSMPADQSQPQNLNQPMSTKNLTAEELTEVNST